MFAFTIDRISFSIKEKKKNAPEDVVNRLPILLSRIPVLLSMTFEEKSISSSFLEVVHFDFDIVWSDSSEDYFIVSSESANRFMVI